MGHCTRVQLSPVQPASHIASSLQSQNKCKEKVTPNETKLMGMGILALSLSLTRVCVVSRFIVVKSVCYDCNLAIGAHDTHRTQTGTIAAGSSTWLHKRKTRNTSQTIENEN
jgi:hypothetical protein